MDISLSSSDRFVIGGSSRKFRSVETLLLATPSLPWYEHVMFPDHRSGNSQAFTEAKIFNIDLEDSYCDLEFTFGYSDNYSRFSFTAVDRSDFLLFFMWADYWNQRYNLTKPTGAELVSLILSIPSPS